MRKIINGRKYDTGTATKIGECENTHDVGDFSHFSESLYRKRTGEYFIAGGGGPMSKYAEACGQNSWTGGKRITPVSYDGARRWAEEYLDVDEYEAEFGKVEE